MHNKLPHSRDNLLLRQLQSAQYDELVSRAERLELPVGTVLADAERVMSGVGRALWDGLQADARPPPLSTAHVPAR